MKVGGRRKLVIPAAMAYGAEDTGDGAPHGDLVFIIDVYAIK
jgi:FKBP-type peptidyl-prolyl cis-trans isomerase